MADPADLPLDPSERIPPKTRMAGAGCVVWLTGLSAAGKTTIARALELRLVAAGRAVRRLDGDELRKSICADLGFSAADRAENIRRASALAKQSSEAGEICVAAFISPQRAERDRARQAVAPSRFIEVFVSAPIEVCRQRDPKGLYARADRGEIRDFTGVSSPYEAPETPDLVVRTDLDSVEQGVAAILRILPPI